MDKLRQANIEWFRMCNTAITIRNTRIACVKKTKLDEESNKNEESRKEEEYHDKSDLDKSKSKIDEENKKEIEEWNRNIFLL